MNLIYQGIPGAYGHIASIKASELLDIQIDKIKGVENFANVWKAIDDNNIGVIPFENSYAGNVHENLYNFLRYDYKIIGEINLEINHYLLSKETKLENIKKVYSHPQALSQCYNYLKEKNIEAHSFGDTAGASKIVKESNEKGVGAIASSLAGEIYSLNILDKNIQDQTGNTTRFFIICPKNTDIQLKQTNNKTSIIFEAKNIPASLYKCLGAFATNNINLTKIESLPSLKGPFTYFFWIDFEGTLKDENVKKALEELKFFTKKLKILGEY